MANERAEEPPHIPSPTRPGEDGISADGPAPDNADSTRSLVRVSVNLTPRAVDALDLACARTRDTKTDTVNRALVVYNLVLDLLERGGGRLTLQSDDGQVERVHLL